MANIIENQNRQVIPKWRSFEKTLDLGELAVTSETGSSQIKNNEPNQINEYLEAWQSNKSVAFAGDLISAAYVYGIVNEAILAACAFIDSNQQIAPPSLLKIAHNLLTGDESKDNNSLGKFNQLGDFIEKNNLEILFSKIRLLKRRIRKFPMNPINYVEIARLHSIIGQVEKSYDYLEIALNLTPNNRFVLRSYARLLFDNKDSEKAYHRIGKLEISKSDPWIMATEIALANDIGVRSKLIKRGVRLIESGKFRPFDTTELACSLGTIELFYGSRRKAKNYLKNALNDPNENTLAQIEWVSEKEGLFEFDPNEFMDVKYNHEAFALDSYHNEKWQEAMNHTEKWFIDIPFSKEPVDLGSKIASTYLDEYETAALFCEAGLNSHPKDILLLNNISYFLAMANKVEEANSYMKKIPNNPNASELTKLCIIATKGLIQYKLGHPERGKFLYKKAIEKAEHLNDTYYFNLAMINFIREEYRSQLIEKESVLSTLSVISDNNEDTEIIHLKNKVIAEVRE